jgi:uncharacterized protein YceH (UPF0502 family)
VIGLDPVQIRVLGCLLEKQQTTPDAYPLTLNSLRLACNQATSRDPVVDYDEGTVREAAQRLGERGYTRLTSYHGSRTSKYRHLLDEALGISSDERALLCVLMLRGPQTLGELKQRSERLHSFPDLSSVEETLVRLTERELGSWLERRPGQKEARYAHLLGEEGPAEDGHGEGGDGVADREAGPAEGETSLAEVQPARQEGREDIAGEVARLRKEIDALREDLDELRRELGAPQTPGGPPND